MTKTKKILIPVIALVVVLITVTAILLFSSKPAESVLTAASHISLAENYLLDLNYVAAIAEYRAAIQIDPKNADYYIALAEVYIEMGDVEAAVAVLEEGLDKVDESGRVKIQALIDELTPKPVEMTTTTALTTTTIPATTTETTTTPQEPVFADYLTDEQYKQISAAVIGKHATEAEAYLLELGLYPLIYELSNENYEPGLVFNISRGVKELQLQVSTGKQQEGDYIELNGELKILRGMTKDEAKSYLESLGVKVYFIYQWNELYGKDIVIDYFHDYHDYSGINSPYPLYVSAGKSPYEEEKYIPDVFNLPFSEAKQILEDAGYTVLLSSYTSTLPVGLVFNIIPSSGSYYADKVYGIDSRVVHISYSSGKNDDVFSDYANRFIMPDLVGMEYTEAKKILDTYNYTVYLREEFNANVPKGIVISQDASNITGNDIYRRAGFVYVSAGTAPFTNLEDYIIIPNVRHMNIEEAKRVFENIGITVDTFAYEHYEGSAYKSGEVFYQSQNGGSYAYNNSQNRSYYQNSIALSYIK